MPLIAIVGREDAATLNEAARLGAADYLTVPPNPAAVRLRLAAGLQRARLQAALTGAQDAADQFVSTVAHDLKTPLTSIKGYADLLLGGAAGPVTHAQADLLEIIHENVERMARFL